MAPSSVSRALAWDEAYGRRGSQWNGRVPGLPALPVGSVALDLGCGDGRVMAAMLANGWLAVGVDFSEAGLSKARRRREIADAMACDRARLELCDILALPFDDCSFDVVAAVHVFAHLDKSGRDAAVAEAARALRPGGTFVFSDFSRGDFRYGSGEKDGEHTFVRGGIHTHYFDEREVLGLVSCLIPVSMRIESWSVGVAGSKRRREEIIATFRKPRPGERLSIR